MDPAHLKRIMERFNPPQLNWISEGEIDAHKRAIGDAWRTVQDAHLEEHLEEAQRIIQDYAAAGTRSAGLAAKAFSVLSIPEVVGGSIREALQRHSTTIAEASLGSRGVSDLLNSESVGTTLQSVESLMSEKMGSTGIATARFSAARAFLDERELGTLNTASAIQDAISRLEGGYAETIRRAVELASNPVVRETIARADPEELTEEVAESLLQEEDSVIEHLAAEAEEAVYLGIDSATLASPEALKRLRTFIIYFHVFIMAVNASPEHAHHIAQYISEAHDRIIDLALLYHMLTDRGPSSKKVGEESEDQERGS